MTDQIAQLRATLPTVAKALAALLVPILTALGDWSAEQVGIDIAVDVSRLESAVLAVLSAAVVYLVPNGSAAQDDNS